LWCWAEILVEQCFDEVGGFRTGRGGVVVIAGRMVGWISDGAGVGVAD